MLTMPMVESRPEGRAMPEHKRGAKKRAAILKELYRRELAGEVAPTVADLSLIIAGKGKKVGVKTVYFHLVALRDADPPMVTWVPRAARTLKLTPEGRAAVTKIGA